MTTADPGVLIPKQRARFRVMFYEPGTRNIIEELHPLTVQTVAIDIGAEDLAGTPEPRHRTGRVVVTLEDDLACKVMTAVRYWQKAQAQGKMFDLVLDTLDGNDHVPESFRFSLCTMEALQHSTWRYDVPCSTTMQLEAPETWVKDDVREKLDTVTRAIAGGVSLRFSGRNPEVPALCQKLLQIGFQVYVHEINTLKADEK